MGNGFDINNINFFTTSLNNVSGPSSVNNQSNEIKVFNGNMTNPVDNNPVYTDADMAQMWLEAGVNPTDAPVAASTVTSLAAMEGAGFDLAELDEIFADEPDVVAHTLTAFQNGSASRIERENQGVATLIENLPEGTTEEEFEAFMYAFNAA